MARDSGLSDVEDRLRRLSDIGDQLEAYSPLSISRCSVQNLFQH